MELNEGIKELIAQNLPELSAGELRKFIEDAEDNKRALKRLNEHFDAAKREIDDLKKENAGLNYLRAEAESVKNERAVLSEQLRDFRVEKAEIAQRNAEDKVNLMDRILGQVFKNPLIKESAYGSSGRSYYDQGGVYRNENTTTSNTITKEIV